MKTHTLNEDKTSNLCFTSAAGELSDSEFSQNVDFFLENTERNMYGVQQETSDFFTGVTSIQNLVAKFSDDHDRYRYLVTKIQRYNHGVFSDIKLPSPAPRLH
ncbi:MAG: hypothetical protein JKY11_04045 [Alphaproteobacteria bacterium]|nr:hypothetical protein [Alphaproteobacteria bacterium]